MSVGHRQRLLEAIGKVHQAPLVLDMWPDALNAIADCVESPSAVLFKVDVTTGTAGSFIHYNIDPQYRDDYVAYYQSLDPWLKRLPHLKPDRAHMGTQLVPDRQMRETGFYHDFLKPQELRYLMTALLNKTARSTHVLSVFHDPKQEDFGNEDKQMFDILAEHVGQALAVQHTLGRLKGLSKGLATALEHLPQAAVLLGRDGRLLHANSAAVNVLYDADGLEVKQGRLEATLPEARASLGKLLQEAFQDLARRVAFKRRVAAVSRPSGRRAYLIRVFPIDQALEYVELDDLNGDPYLVMLITESEAAGPVLSTEELQVVYGLTPTEAAVAAALARGHSLSEIAARKDIAVDTVRKQLQSIFQKTGTHRQAALVHRLVVDLAMG